MFVSGQSELAVVIFSALTFSVSIPSAVKVFNWLSTMYRGSIKLDAPMLYALAFIFLFGIGGLTGLFLATLATDVHLHDTYFIVAHFHYTMMGGVMIAFLGGIYYWWPKMFGRMYSMKWANVGAWLVFIGFNLTFFVQFIMGSKGMPRRYFNYPPEFEIYHQISSLGSYVLAVGLFLAGGVLVHSLMAGRRAPKNPYGGATLEWQAESPPTHHNFEGPLVLNDPYDFSGLRWDEAEQGYVLEARDKETVSP
jgi:cytochrome c oxidase subunit 1